MLINKKYILTIYRFGHWVFYSVKTPVIREGLLTLYRLVYFLTVKIPFGVSIPPQTTIGESFKLLHNGNGVVIAEKAVIGDNCICLHQVTIGDRHKGWPLIGERCPRWVYSSGSTSANHCKKFRQ